MDDDLEDDGAYSVYLAVIFFAVLCVGLVLLGYGCVP